MMATIAFYDNKEGWRAFVEEVLKLDLAALSGLKKPTLLHKQEPTSVHWSQMALGAGWYIRLIQPLPVFVEVMIEAIREKEGPAHSRAALAGALAYLVQERDIIADDTGGGYGLVDDALIAYYTYYKYLRALALREPDVQETMNNYCREMEAVIRTGLRIFPTPKLGELRAILQDISLGFYFLPEVPSYLLEQITEQIIQDPREYGAKNLLARLSYHLNIRFPTNSGGPQSDPILALLDALTVAIGSTPGEVTSDANYDYY